MADTQHISWGRPSIYVKDLEAESPAWKKVPTPVEDSTTLDVTAGDKQEAKIEGGDYEDVKYNKNNSTLSYEIRLASGREMPISGDEGVVEHKYAVALVPENPTAPGFCIQRSTVSILPSYTADDGVKWKYSHDALTPESGAKIKFGTLTVADSSGTITISGKGLDFGEESQTL